MTCGALALRENTILLCPYLNFQNGQISGRDVTPVFSDVKIYKCHFVDFTGLAQKPLCFCDDANPETVFTVDWSHPADTGFT